MTCSDDESLTWPSGRTVCLDLGLRELRGDPWVVSDLESAGWIERYSAQDPSLAPAGEQLVQGQMPIRPEESEDEAAAASRAICSTCRSRIGASGSPGAAVR